MNQEKWQKLSLAEQMGNTGAEIIRAINWQEKNEAEDAANAAGRAIELIDLMISDSRWQRRQKATPFADWYKSIFARIDSIVS